MMIEDRLKIIEDKISDKCLHLGRKKSDIVLIGVSKTKPLSCIDEAFKAGILNFGENKAQELNSKSQQYKENIIWHFIGHLQSNKVKFIIESAGFIHSIDSMKLLTEISKRAAKINKVQKILCEIKTSEEESKLGINSYDEAMKLIEYCELNDNIDFQGLMTMAPFTEDTQIIRNSFIKLSRMKEAIEKSGTKVQHLSMGMSNDYEIALEEGSTMLRIGTAIFGHRNYSLS